MTPAYRTAFRCRWDRSGDRDGRKKWVLVFCRRGTRPVVSFFPAPPEPWYYQTAVIAKVAEIYLYFSAHFALSAVTKKEAICGTIIIL